MNNKKIGNKKLDILFLIIVSVQTILMGILFIVQVLRIYLGNNKKFNREICGEYILQILPVIIIWIIIIAFNYIYFRSKKNINKDSAKIPFSAKLKIFEYMCPENNNMELQSEKKKRLIAFIINICIIIVCCIMGLCYLLNDEHFIPNDKAVIKDTVQMTLHLLPWGIISLISSVLYCLYVEYSSRKSIEYIKQIIKENGRSEKIINDSKRKNLAINITRVSIICIAVAFIVIGIINGGATDVLQKAIEICTECIGLG